MKGKLQRPIVIRTVRDGWCASTEGIGETELGGDESIDLGEEPELDGDDGIIDLGVEPELGGDDDNDLGVEHKRDNKVGVMVVVEIVVGTMMI